MNILLDECLPRKLKLFLRDHVCQTVQEAGYAGKTNGELLEIAEAAGFDIFLSLDRGIFHQQNLAGREISLVILRAKSSRLADIKPLLPTLLDLLLRLRPGTVEIIGT